MTTILSVDIFEEPEDGWVATASFVKVSGQDGRGNGPQQEHRRKRTEIEGERNINVPTDAEHFTSRESFPCGEAREPVRQQPIKFANASAP